MVNLDVWSTWASRSGLLAVLALFSFFHFLVIIISNEQDNTWSIWNPITPVSLIDYVICNRNAKSLKVVWWISTHIRTEIGAPLMPVLRMSGVPAVREIIDRYSKDILIKDFTRYIHKVYWMISLQCLLSHKVASLQSAVTWQSGSFGCGVRNHGSCPNDPQV